MVSKPYNSYSESLRKLYGARVYRIGVDAGFSCPNRRGPQKEGGCIYCDSLGASAVYQRTFEGGFHKDSPFHEEFPGMAEYACMREQIQKGKEFLKTRYKAERFSLYFQSFSNTFAPVNVLKATYDAALGNDNWTELIVSTRPDCLSEEVLTLLSSYNQRVERVCVEIGLQSGDDEILKNMNRGHNVKCFEDACRRAKARGLSVCAHALVGFPGETEASLERTIDMICRTKPDAIKIHNLNIASGTRLYDAYLQGEVSTPCAERYMFNVIKILRSIPSGIVIERLLCETPMHRLAAPRTFPDKNSFLNMLEKRMSDMGAKQGDRCNVS